MASAPSVTFSHIGLHCFDVEKMLDFYTRVIGLKQTDRGDIGLDGGGSIEMVFLSGEARDHHQLALVPGRDVQQGSVLLNQMAFRVDSLETLREREATVRGEGISDIRPTTHGNAWSLYFPDPEGNIVELFVDTPWHVSQPRRGEFDISQPDKEIARVTKAAIEDEPSFTSMREWKATFRAEEKTLV